MNLLIKLSASAFVLISVLSITSCSPNTPAQKGYEKAKAHLKENIKVPNSLKINGGKIDNGVLDVSGCEIEVTNG